MKVSARHEDGLLLLDAALPQPRPSWELVGRTAGLPDGAKIALADGLRLRAELSIGSGDGAAEREARACADFDVALRRLWRDDPMPRRRDARDESDAPEEPDGPIASDELEARLRAAGVAPATDDATDDARGIGFTLAAPGPPIHARASTHGGIARLSVGLPAPQSSCALAVCTLMARLNAAFRIVRATGRPGTARLEVVLGADAETGAWQAGIAALTIAARHSLREAEALGRDADLAELYLALSEPLWRSGPAFRRDTPRRHAAVHTAAPLQKTSA